MRRRFNYLVETGPGGVIAERDLATCGHCQYQMAIPPAKVGTIIVRVDSPCTGCGKYVCNVCKAKQEPCKTWEKRMEESERRAMLLQRILG